MTDLYALAETLATAFNSDKPVREGDLTVWSPRAEHYPQTYFVEHRLNSETKVEQVNVWTWTEPIFTLIRKGNDAPEITFGTTYPAFLTPMLRTSYALSLNLFNLFGDMATANARIEEQERQINRLTATIETMSAERGIIRDS